VPLVAELLQLPVGERYPALTMAPEQKRRRLFAVLMGWVFGAARLQPLVMVVEDLHWLDPSTLELQQLLAEQGATVPLMLLYTARPEFRAPWPMRGHHAQSTLNRLSARDVREMVAQVAARNALASESVDAVVERTSGVPLFVEELTRAVLESGQAKPGGREIPVTLHDSLMARLDRLGPAKEIIQLGAVIGSEFSYELLRAVHPMAELELQAALARLTEAELLYVSGIVPDATYQFKHALIREAAYEALLKSRRKELHRLVAGTIDEKFATLKETHPEVLARHWSEAGEIELAIAEWSRASKAAEGRNAFTEAEQSYMQALALLNLLPESPERDARELRLWQSLYSVLQMTRGYSAAETIDAAERAAALAEKSGSLTQLVNWIISKATIAIDSGDFAGGIVLADQALELALRDGNPTNLGLVYRDQINVRLFLGDLAGVEKHFAAGFQFFAAPGFRQVTAARALALSFASHNAWHLGRAELARERIAQMLAAANANNPFELALADIMTAVLHLLMGEYEQAEPLAARALELSEKNQLPQLTAFSSIALGWARAHLGRPSEGIALIRKAIALLAEIGTRSEGTLQITALAEAQILAGAFAEALETIEQVLQPDRPGLPLWRPKALRLRGEVQLKLGQTELAEADFRDAIALAQKLGAKAWELRASMSLARLLASERRRAEARTMLTDIYNWFTEGFDTADLKEAKALLNELSN
jgi:tetratricopeptide (TPR) repeat protein